MSVSNREGKKNRFAGEDSKMKKKILGVMAALLITATAAFANTGATNTNTVSPTLVINATIVDAVLLTLKTGTLAGINHCTIAAGGGGDYNMSFGTVDGLGVSAGNCNVFAPTTPGSTPAVYWTDYQLTPAWAGLTATSAASITAFAAAPEAGVAIQVPSTGTDTNTSGGLTVATWTTIGTTAGTATPVVSGTVLSGAGADGTSQTRFLALSVSPTATAAAGGGTALTTTVTYTMTIK
jgi:hypothetical protein